MAPVDAAEPRDFVHFLSFLVGTAAAAPLSLMFPLPWSVAAAAIAAAVTVTVVWLVTVTVCWAGHTGAAPLALGEARFWVPLGAEAGLWPLSEPVPGFCGLLLPTGESGVVFPPAAAEVSFAGDVGESGPVPLLRAGAVFPGDEVSGELLPVP